ncbi:MAG: hypothetical protein PHC62_03625 [Candidatus Izemoplasmatales bacterium]|jgi:uncharacterized paraquat-inducible protein A|nr:hypothetical protein [Candidatus Izemoplasmatales bacterium]
MSQKVDKTKVEEFFREIEGQESLDKAAITGSSKEQQTNNKQEAKPYVCPKCHKSLSTRKEPCKYCHYDGYIPMGDAEIKKTRTFMFIILIIISISVYLLTR